MKTLIAGDNPSLSSLDLSPCTKLVTVDVGDDGLTSLNMTGLTALASLDASGNKLRFSTVTKPAFFKTGNYSNQHDNSIAIPASVAIGQEIDLSAEYVDGRSVYTWSGGANPAVTGGKAKFTTADIGKTTACVITHPDYPGLEVNTTQTKVIPAEAIFTLTTSNSSGEFSFTLNNDAQKVFVDFGEGFVEKSAGSISGTLSASTVKVYAENVTSLSVPSQHLTGVNLARLTELETLDVSGNPALGMPDLSHNTALTSLNVSGNELTTLDTSALTALTALDASGNKLKFSTVTQPDGFTGGNYSNQDNDPIEIANPVKEGQEIDLSAEYVDGRSVYTWNPTVDFTCANGIISFGDNARGKNITGTITHPDYSGLTVSVTGIRVMSGFEVDDDGSGVTAEPEDDITLEGADGNPIDIDDVIIRIRRLTADELASEKTAITAKGFVVTDDDTMDGYDISLVDRSGRPVKITGNAGIRIKFPYSGIDRASNTFVLYHNDSVAGIEVIDCSANEDGLEFVGHRFSHYSFVASPNSSGDDSSSSGDDTSSDNGNDGGNKGNKSDVPRTGESPVMLSLAYLLLVISLAGAYFSIYMKRLKETGNYN